MRTSKPRRTRAPRAFEIRLLSLTAIPARLDIAVADLQAGLPPLLLAQASDTPPEASTRDLATLLSIVMREMATFGAEQVRLELTRQGAADLTGPVILTELAARLTCVSHDLDEDVQQLRATVLRKLRPRPLSTAARSRAVRDLITRGLLPIVNRYARRVTHEGFALGRASEMQAVQVPTTRFDLARRRPPVTIDQVVFTAILDHSVCDHCETVDGEVVAFGSARYDELMPPYYLCRGQENCRCAFVAVLSDGNIITIEDGEVVDEQEASDDLDES